VLVQVGGLAAVEEIQTRGPLELFEVGGHWANHGRVGLRNGLRRRRPALGWSLPSELRPTVARIGSRREEKREEKRATGGPANIEGFEGKKERMKKRMRNKSV
jgi:hypothetical protein